MLGLAFIGIIIVFSFLAATGYTYAARVFRHKKIDAKNAPTNTSSSRIYYVKNSAPIKRRKSTKRPSVPIKGAVIEKSPDGFDF